MVRALIAERFAVRLSHSSVCRLLIQLGLTALRPLWRAYQQDPEAVEQWLEKEYPAVGKPRRDTDIFCRCGRRAVGLP